MDYSVFDQMFDPISVFDDQLRVIYSNQSFCNMCGISARRGKSGKPFTDLIKIDDDLLGGRISITEFEDFGFYREVEVINEDGSRADIQYMLQELQGEDSEQRLFLLFIRDVRLEKKLHSKYRNELDQKEGVITQLEEAKAELQDYSQNLEHKVEERTAELLESYKLQTAMLDSVSQGFFIIDRDKNILPQYSKVCEEWFGEDFKDKKFHEFVMKDTTKWDEITNWVDAVFSDMIPFDDVVGLAPVVSLKVNDYEMQFEYFSMVDNNGVLMAIVVVASDMTEQLRMEKELDRERSFAQMLTKVLEHRAQFQSFIRESKDFFKQVADNPDFISSDNAETFLRHLHTLKGGAATFRLFDLENETHSLEEDLGDFQSQQLDEFKVKGISRKVQILENILDESVNTVRLWLQMPDLDEERKLVISIGDLVNWYLKLMENEETQTFARMIRDEYMLVRIEDSLSHLNSEAHRVAKKTGKLLKPVKFLGGDVKVFPEHYSGLFGSLVHAIRNSVDHGLEIPDERSGAGKDEQGEIVIAADRFTEGDQTWLQVEISDDGQGIDIDRLRSRLPEDLQTKLCDEEVLDMIFSDGVSTSTKTTEISGRGIGMSAIRAEANALGGKVWIESDVGFGSKLFVKVPLTFDVSTFAEIAKSA